MPQWGALFARIGPEKSGRVIYLPEVDSTNTYLSSLARNGAPAGTAVFAEYQTAGKGRMGRSFHSPEGQGIYMSYLLRPEGGAEDISRMTAWTAVAVCRAIERVCPAECGIKWVNDIIAGGKKVCGILLESVSVGGSIDGVVCGVGINVNEEQTDFPEDIRGKATSLFASTGNKIDRTGLMAVLLEELDRMAADWPGGRTEYLDEYRRRCVTVGRDVLVVRGGEAYTAKALRVEEDFSLTVLTGEGEKNVSSGEVSVRGLYGYME